MNKKYFPFLMLMLLFAMSCSNTKYLPEGELLYVGGDVKIEDNEASRKERKVLKNQLEGMLRPKPNSAILGLRPKLYIYNIAGQPKKPKGILPSFSGRVRTPSFMKKTLMAMKTFMSWRLMRKP